MITGYLGVKNLNPLVFKINFKNSKKKIKIFMNDLCINLLIDVCSGEQIIYCKASHEKTKKCSGMS